MKGDGQGTVLNFIPSSTLTDAIQLQGQTQGIQDLNIRANGNITNHIHIVPIPHTLYTPGSWGRIKNIQFWSPNTTISAVHYPGQHGIFHDSTATAGSEESSFWWQVENCHFMNLETGIKGDNNVWATSMLITNPVTIYCRNGIDIYGAQYIVQGGWFQGSDMLYGVFLRGTARQNHIYNCIGEAVDQGPLAGQQVACVGIASGAVENEIIGCSNGYATANPNCHSVYDVSGNTTNMIMDYDFKASPTTGRLKHFRFDGQSAYLKDIGTAGGTGIMTMAPLTPGQFMHTQLISGITSAPSTNNLRNVFRFHNRGSGTDEEYLDMWAQGTDGFKIFTYKSGAGVARNLKIGGNATTVVEVGDNTLGFFGTTPIAKKAANANTSGATTPQLETEVNELKQLLRDYGLMA